MFYVLPLVTSLLIQLNKPVLPKIPLSEPSGYPQGVHYKLQDSQPLLTKIVAQLPLQERNASPSNSDTISRLLLPFPKPVVTLPTFNSQQFDQQFILYQQYVALMGPPDVLIVGSSRALQGVDPIALQQMLVTQGQEKLKIFNFGINGATSQVVNLLLQQIIPEEQLPRLILWADGVRAFNSGRPDLTYNGIVSSKGYQLLTTMRRKNSSQTFSSQDRICIDIPLGYFSNKAATQPLSALLMATLIHQSSDDQECKPFQKGSRSSDSTLSKSTFATSLKALQLAGFQVASQRFNPSTYYRRYPKVAGNYDADYKAFNLQGQQLKALLEVINFVQSKQIPLVFINLPLTQNYLDPVRQKYEKQFQQQMQKLANQHQGFLFRNLNQTHLQRNEYFVDPSHINQYGALAVSKDLAQDSTIPWPVSAEDTLSQSLSSFSFLPLLGRRLTPSRRAVLR